MTINPEIKKMVEKNMDLMITQTGAYLPFLKTAFPNVKDLPDFCFNMMIGNALTTFLSQYALRMQSPKKDDFSEFGIVVEKYRKKVKGMFR